jgi:hypothetical protein
MNHIRRILAAVATLAGALMALATAPAAYASLPPHGGSGGGVGGAHTTVPVIAASGMPGWQITLIAAAAAVVAATLAVLIDRARVARRTHATTA